MKKKNTEKKEKVKKPKKKFKLSTFLLKVFLFFCVIGIGNGKIREKIAKKRQLT